MPQQLEGCAIELVWWGGGGVNKGGSVMAVVTEGQLTNKHKKEAKIADTEI